MAAIGCALPGVAVGAAAQTGAREDTMTDQNTNPFVLPGMGQGGSESGGNPLIASMEMMRQAWTNLMGPNGLAQTLPMTPPMNIQDLERRIAELRTVESWLRMNLSMLSSTIQGLEVQRSTIATLRSFVDTLGSQGQGAGGWGEASPLEVALGLKPAHRRDQAEAGDRRAAGGSGAERPSASGSGSGGAGSPEAGSPEPAGASEPADAGMWPPGMAAAGAASSRASTAGKEGRAQAASGKADAPGSSAGSAQAISQAAQSASEAWWGMLQQQFNQLAAATAATMPAGATPAPSPGMPDPTQASGQKATPQDASEAAQPPTRSGSARATRRDTGRAASKRSPSGGAQTAAGKSASARKTTPRKSAVRKNKIQSDSDQS